MLRSDQGGFTVTIVWGVVVRIGLVASILVVYGQFFRQTFQWIGGPAFLLAMIPCVVAGTLLGVWGGVAAVAVTFVLDHALAVSVGIGGSAVLPTIIVATVTKLVLGVAPGLVARSARRLRLVNERLVDEARLRQKSERLLAGSESRYRALTENLGAGVGLFDAKGLCVFANPALCSVLNKPQREILGTTFESHLDEPSQAYLVGVRTARSSNVRSYEVTLHSRESCVLLVNETHFPDCEKVGEPPTEQTLCVVRDISDRVASERKQRELERQLQRGQALQSLAVLAGGVAHDFNNLLCGIVGNAELALRRAPKPASLELTECLEEIREFASEAGQLSRQMLAYAGRRSLSTKAVAVNVEVREALRLLHSTIEAQAVLRLDLSDGLEQVTADRLQLRQVVTNLVLNALEAMAPNRGTLTIRSFPLELDKLDLEKLGAPEGQGRGEYVVVAISDNGAGIPAEIIERIYEPFFSTKAPGRGMGLAASVGIVRAHKGFLDVASEPGRGTTFRILLPLSRGSAQPFKRLTPTALRAWRSGTILLIDDEAAVRVVTTRLLTELGQKVLTASNGQQGIAVFRQHLETIDLVLLDLTMPELSGAEVLAELCRLRKDVSVVITSGFHPSDATELLSLPNVKGFLEKPHTLANLEAIVGTVLPD